MSIDNITVDCRQRNVTHMVVVMNAVERVIVRVTGSPTDAAIIRIGIVITVPFSVLAHAANHHLND